MNSLQEDQIAEFLADVNHAARGRADVRWTDELLSLTAEAAERYYGADMCPVWARDADLTAHHLATMKHSMDSSSHAAIVQLLAELLTVDLSPSVEASEASAGSSDVFSAPSDCWATIYVPPKNAYL
jgi:hypothetical protein